MDMLNDTANMYYQRAEGCIKESDITNAVKLLKQSLESNENNIKALNLLGICYYTISEFKLAKNCFRKSLQLQREDNIASDYLKRLTGEDFNRFMDYYNLGIKKFYNNEFKDCIDIFKNVADNNQDLIEPFAILGICYYNLKNKSKAAEYLKKAHEMDKGNNDIKASLIKLQKPQPFFMGKDVKFFARFGIIALIIIVIASIIAFGTKKIISYENQKKSIAAYQKQLKTESLLRQQTEESNRKLQSEINRMINDGQAITTSTSKISRRLTVDDEKKIYQEGLADFKAKKYSEALGKFDLIINYATTKTYVEEAVFFAASASEKLNYQGKAVKYYLYYIEKFKNGEYYDDSLYYCGLLLYQSDRKVEAKIILNKLVRETPKSMFVNKRVKDLLKSI